MIADSHMAPTVTASPSAKAFAPNAVGGDAHAASIGEVAHGSPADEADKRSANQAQPAPQTGGRGRVAGKVALVTGAASGLGEAIARLLAREGAAVVVADIDDRRGDAVATSIVADGGQATYLPLDVTQEMSWENAMREVLRRHRSLHILVNNAGIAPAGSMTMSFELWRKVMSINLDGTFLGTKHAIQTMRSIGATGSIINISSVMAMVGQPTTAAYSASKGGVRSLTKAAAVYCAAERLPIRVNSIHPGTCTTPLVENFYASQPEALAQQIARHPFGHLGEPDDIAFGVLYLASDEAKFLLGTELVIDGGLLASD